MASHIPSNTAPAASSSTSSTASGNIAQSLAAGASLWAKISQIQPINAELRPLAQQTLEKAFALGAHPTSLTGSAELNSAKGLLAAIAQQASSRSKQGSNLSATPGTSQAQNPLGQWAQLLQAKQLFLVQALLRGQSINMITDQALTPNSRVQIQLGPQGLSLVAQQAPADQQQAQPANTSGKLNPLNPSDRNALQALLRQALPAQQSSANAVKALQLLIDQINQNTANKPASAGQKTLLNALQSLTQILPANTSAPALKAAINNSGIFSEAKLNQLHQGANPQAANVDAIKAPAQDSKLQLWQLFALLSDSPQVPSSAAEAAKPNALKASNLAQQLLNLLGISLEKMPQASAEKTQHKQALTEIGKQWLAKITAQQLANLVDEPDSKTLKNLTIELPVRIEQQVTPLQLHFSKHWLEEEQEKQGAASSETDKKRDIVWQVTLSINVETLGTIDARIRYVHERLQCSLWAEQPSTLALIENRASQLVDTIRQKGLAVEPIHCHAGRMPSPSNRLSQPLLDTHA
ncbi:flagellar hook-length control protein FliK [Simiduia curdlanivorans]|uniref:Flagellar hook-length control protein FliK n=1 Tax=Simiduia curdlanivorans TaxID=1492769 RepID=A0ABV8VB57_9GAMM|nr:flagellar hook-length control protein FliK [Simiduia curdlanivorans]MDN3639365.1 flagellar hook-length control protein FliK [Simiduia curdlanivorans]